MADMYALSKIRDNFMNDKYLFCGKAGNIGLSWKKAAKIMNLEEVLLWSLAGLTSLVWQS